jgi:hypothetical protein
MSDTMAADVLDLAVDTLAEWIEGYTFPEEGPQLRVRTVLIDDDSLIVRVEKCDERGEEPRDFDIWLRVEERI